MAYALLFVACTPEMPSKVNYPAEITCADLHGQSTDCLADDLRACDQKCRCNDYDACATLGVMHELGPARIGRQWQAKPSAALAEYQRACDGGSNSGCVLLGNAYQRGVIVPASNDRARVAFNRACSSGYGWGCFRLGTLELSLDRARALAALRRSCELADAEGCWTFATKLLEGNDAREHDEAVSALTQGCEKGTSAGSDEFSQARARGFVAKACATLGELKSVKGAAPSM